MYSLSISNITNEPMDVVQVLSGDLYELNALGMLQARSYKTVAAWNMTYRQVEGFPHPNPYIQCGEQPLPRLLEIFPDAKDQNVSFALKNLAKLTIEGVHDFILSKVIPRLRGCPYKETSIQVSKFPSVQINRLVSQLRFLS